MRVAGAIFDLDGTIADTFGICFATFRNALACVQGPSLTDADIHALFGPSEDETADTMAPMGWEGGGVPTGPVEGVIANLLNVAVMGVVVPGLATRMPALAIRENQLTTSLGVCTVPSPVRAPPSTL